MLRLKALIRWTMVMSFVASAAFVALSSVFATPAVLESAALAHVVPTSFCCEGQRAPTQTSNTAAVQWGAGKDARLVIVGMVDTSGYSSDVRAKYQGFFIADSPVSVGGKELGTGAYGFGFTEDGHLNIFDIGGRQILSAPATKDTKIQRPRPILIRVDSGEVRFYSGRDYAVINTR
ncbi:MAG: hypothetical protein DMF66_03515 [Acidobacteria bacterium]|nr:MAG: hypothetical protein DMF66_03515 [Acidobacteriota bacterium]